MLKVTKTGPKHLNITLDGALDATTMRQGLDELVSLSEDITGGTMLYRVKNIVMPTMGALAVEVGYLPSMFGLLRKFDKCAVCTDMNWVAKWSEIEGALLPGFEIKAFALDDVAAAEAWLAA